MSDLDELHLDLASSSVEISMIRYLALTIILFKSYPNPARVEADPSEYEGTVPGSEEGIVGLGGGIEGTGTLLIFPLPFVVD